MSRLFTTCMCELDISHFIITFLAERTLKELFQPSTVNEREMFSHELSQKVVRDGCAQVHRLHHVPVTNILIVQLQQAAVRHLYYIGVWHRVAELRNIGTNPLQRHIHTRRRLFEDLDGRARREPDIRELALSL